MGILPKYRACGLGLRLLEATLVDVQKQGFKRIELKVRASNEPAIRLYKKTGFEIEGLLKNDVLVDGKFDSTLCMALFPDASE